MVFVALRLFGFGIVGLAVWLVSRQIQAFCRNWGGLLALLSVVVAAILLGIYI
jgi:hypothetical protein